MITAAVGAARATAIRVQRQSAGATPAGNLGAKPSAVAASQADVATLAAVILGLCDAIDAHTAATLDHTHAIVRADVTERGSLVLR